VFSLSRYRGIQYARHIRIYNQTDIPNQRRDRNPPVVGNWQAEKEQADATSTSLMILWGILIDVIIYGTTGVRESTRVGRTCVDKR